MSQYELRLIDHAGNTAARFAGMGRGVSLGGLQSFSYRKRLRTPGAITVRLFGTDTRIAEHLLLPGALDYRWQVWRKDVVAGLDWYMDFEAFHRAEESRFTQSGQRIYVSYATGLNALLYSEPIQWPAGSTQAYKNADCATAAAEYVNENIGTAAGNDTNGDTRIRPGLYVAPYAASGTNWRGGRANKMLANVIDEIADIAPADYNILSTPTGLAFTWRNTRWGDDLTGAAELFSAQKGTATNISFDLSYLDEITTCYALGQGVDDLRKVITWSDNIHLTYAPTARRAVCRSANQEHNTAALSSLAEAKVLSAQARFGASFSVLQTRNTRYGQAYDYGDLVSIKDDYGRVADLKIVGVTVGIGQDGAEKISLETESE